MEQNIAERILVRAKQDKCEFPLIFVKHQIQGEKQGQMVLYYIHLCKYLT